MDMDKKYGDTDTSGIKQFELKSEGGNKKFVKPIPIPTIKNCLGLNVGSQPTEISSGLNAR